MTTGDLSRYGAASPLTIGLRRLGGAAARVRPARLVLGALLRARRRTLCRALVRAHGCVVLSGPFRGMRYLPELVAVATPRFVGTYEAELASIVAAIIARGYPIVVNVGCAEGYYAVGLARRMPAARVYAFDRDVTNQRRCKVLAQRNGVADRVVVAGACVRADLERLPLAGGLVVCDCDGCEQALLDPAAVPGLRAADVLVELHDVFRPGVTRTILERFAPTHEVELVESAERDPDAVECLRPFPPAKRRLAVAEFRAGPMQWAFMRAR